MKQLSAIALVACLYLGCLSLVGCRQVGETPSADANRPIVLGTTLNPRTLDPADVYELSGMILLGSLGDRLYTYEPGTTTLKPQLATALPKVSDDGITYTIPLRQDVVFHDGTPFDAEAMAFSLRRFIENKGRPSFLLADTVARIDVTGSHELTIRLKQPFSAFPSLLGFPGICAVSPKFYEISPGEFKPQEFVGTGPYKLTEIRPDGMQLEVFENYWGEQPANPGITIQRFSSPANLYNAFLTGSVDVAYQSLDPDQIRALEERAPDRNWQVSIAEGTVIGYMVLNVQQPPLDRVNVRRAIAALIDREAIVDRVFMGQSDPLYTTIPTAFQASRPVFQERFGQQDVATAKALLTREGFSPENPLVLDVWYPTSSVSRNLVAIALKAQIERDAEGFVRVDIHNVEAATAYGYLDKGVYPSFLVFWYPDFSDPDNYIQPFLDCAKGSQATGCEEGASQTQGSFYYSDRIRDLIGRSRRELDPAKRQQLFAEIQEILVSDVPFIPLWQTRDYAFAQPNIGGVRIEPTLQFPLAPIHREPI